MKKNTSKDYEEAIRGKYYEEKTGDYAEYLVNPTPKLLKRLAALRYDAASATDKETFNRFFSFSGNDIHRQIEKFDGDKLKPLCKFLKGETSTFKNPSSLELIAVLVDFHPRPLKNFIHKGVAEVDKEKEVEPIEDSVSSSENSSVQLGYSSAVKHKTKIKLQAIIFFVLLFTLGGYVINDQLTKRCMIWNYDHYEAVDCDEQANNFISSQKIIQLDKETLEHQKKIVVTDTTQFFLENGSPCIWYAKRGGKIEYFTYPGLHPETGETLKIITPYMINKYVYK